MPRHAALLAVFVLATFPAAAQDCPLTYEKFEFAVPHIDLEACPNEMAGDKRFCRATIGGDMLHVYAFAEDGEQCLLGMQSLAEDKFQITFK